MMAAMVAMMATADPLTSIPIHRSTLRVLQRMKNSGETWDDFLFELTDDFLSPALKSGLDARAKRDIIIPGADARRQFEERRKRARPPR